MRTKKKTDRVRRFSKRSSSPHRTALAEKIEKLLREGLPIPEVAARLNCTVRWVSFVATAKRLPRNINIPQGSPRERAILQALATYDIPTVADLYRQTDDRIRKILNDHTKRLTSNK